MFLTTNSVRSYLQSPPAFGVPDDDYPFESLMRSVFSELDFNVFSNEEEFRVRVGSTCSMSTSQGLVSTSNSLPLFLSVSTDANSPLPVISQRVSSDGCLLVPTSGQAGRRDSSVSVPIQVRKTLITSGAGLVMLVAPNILISSEEVFTKYGHRLAHTKDLTKATFMACKLAREVFFGDSFRSQCTAIGKRAGLKSIDPIRIENLLDVLRSKFSPKLTTEAFIAKYKRVCLTSIAQTCNPALSKD